MLNRTAALFFLLFTVTLCSCSRKEKSPKESKIKEKISKISPKNAKEDAQHEEESFTPTLPQEAIDAVAAYDLEKVKSLIAAGLDINARNKLGATMLYTMLDPYYQIRGEGKYAGEGIIYINTSRKRFIELLEFFINNGADIHLKVVEKNTGKETVRETPLMICRGFGGWGHKAKYSYWYSTSQLEYKYDPNDLKALMTSPCADAIAIFAKRPEFIVNGKVNGGQWVTGWVLGVLAEVGDLKTIKHLVEERGVEVDKDILAYATHRTSKETISYLLKKGASVGTESHCPPIANHRTCTDHETVLHYLVLASAEGGPRGHSGYKLYEPKVIKRLKEEGLYVDTRETIKLLIENGADVNAKNENGKTPIWHSAARFCRLDIAQLLLENGAKLDDKDKFVGGVRMSYERFKKYYPKQKEECRKMIKFFQSFKEQKSNEVKKIQTK